MKKAILLLLIVGVAFLLRFNKVWDNPPALSWDEVSIGYNAYSILKTGKDEHGRFLPLDTFVAYGDYKPPLAVYLTVPFVAVFGLNETSVRLPSVTFGALTVLFTFFLVSELFYGLLNKKSQILGVVSSLVLAISPWHINISRGGFEANIALFFIVFGVWYVLSARRKPSRWVAVWIPFVAAIYTFNSARYFSVFIVFGLFCLLLPEIKKNFRIFSFGVIIALMLLVPIMPHLLSKEARLRFVEVNIFTDSAVIKTSNARIAAENSSVFSKIINNRRVGYARSYLLHFMDNLEPGFLFVKGDGNPKFSIQDVGQMYMIEAPLLVIGVITMLLLYPSVALFLLFWLITSIIPAATARETPHALRILNSLPTWHIFIAFGVLQITEYLGNHDVGKKILRKSFIGSLVFLYCMSVIYYLHNYYNHYPSEFSGEWQYGYKQALEYTGVHTGQYKKIYISETIGRAYMYTLFYTRYDPEKYRNSKKSYFDAAGFYHVNGFGKYIFTDGSLPPLEGDSLYILPSGQTPKGVVIQKTIPLLNGEPVLSIFTKG